MHFSGQTSKFGYCLGQLCIILGEIRVIRFFLLICYLKNELLDAAGFYNL